MTPVARTGRYSDWLPGVTGSTHDKNPFFAGDAVAHRMAALRRAIHEIRSNWNQYSRFMSELRNFLEGDDVTADDDAVRRAESFFNSTKDWSAQSSSDDFSALRLYTSSSGYRRIFRTINAALRGGGLVDDEQAMRAAAFLVETLTIDLFHYRSAYPNADDFEGCVYRGMCVNRAELSRFLDLAAEPLSNRYVSVPLALVSASRSLAQAVDFATRAASVRPGTTPIVWRIHVASLDGESLRIYRQHFPLVVVTSICAVPIERVSNYPHEQEVLLRGPFFQILRFGFDRLPRGSIPLHVIDAVMLNSNRDHISAIASDEGEDRSARDLFRILVSMRRMEICGMLAAEFAPGDTRGYRSMAEQWRRELESHQR